MWKSQYFIIWTPPSPQCHPFHLTPSPLVFQNMSAMQHGAGGHRPPSRASHASRTSEVSRGAQSLYSVGSVHSVRSTVRSTVPLTAQADTWKPPVLKKALFTSIPKASNITAIYSIVSPGTDDVWCGWRDGSGGRFGGMCFL